MKLIAFWKYDQFPYCLWGEVVEFMSGGTVKTREYGSYTFKPIAVYPEDEGLAIANRLEQIRQDYIDERKELLKKYRKDSENAAPFLK